MIKESLKSELGEKVVLEIEQAFKTWLASFQKYRAAQKKERDDYLDRSKSSAEKEKSRNETQACMKEMKTAGEKYFEILEKNNLRGKNLYNKIKRKREEIARGEGRKSETVQSTTQKVQKTRNESSTTGTMRLTRQQQQKQERQHVVKQKRGLVGEWIENAQLLAQEAQEVIETRAVDSEGIQILQKAKKELGGKIQDSLGLLAKTEEGVEAVAEAVSLVTNHTQVISSLSPSEQEKIETFFSDAVASVIHEGKGKGTSEVKEYIEEVKPIDQEKANFARRCFQRLAEKIRNLPKSSKEALLSVFSGIGTLIKAVSLTVLCVAAVFTGATVKAVANTLLQLGSDFGTLLRKVTGQLPQEQQKSLFSCVGSLAIGWLCRLLGTEWINLKDTGSLLVDLVQEKGTENKFDAMKNFAGKVSGVNNTVEQVKSYTNAFRNKKDDGSKSGDEAKRRGDFDSSPSPSLSFSSTKRLN